jgi:hypothetical protein
MACQVGLPCQSLAYSRILTQVRMSVPPTHSRGHSRFREGTLTTAGGPESAAGTGAQPAVRPGSG